MVGQVEALEVEADLEVSVAGEGALVEVAQAEAGKICFHLIAKRFISIRKRKFLFFTKK